MKKILITYDISDDGNRAKCREAIEEYDYIEICESDYIIRAADDLSVTSVKNALKKYIKKGDKLFVCEVGAFAGQGTGVTDWWG